MKVSPTTIERIARRLRDPNMPKINQSDIARHMGLGRAWVSKLMTGGIQELKEDQVDRLQDLLGIKFQVLAENGTKIPAPAVRAAKLMQESPAFRDAFLALVDLGESLHVSHSPRFYETREMNGLGRKVAQIVSECGDKHGKIAAQVLALMTEQP